MYNQVKAQTNLLMIFYLTFGINQQFTVHIMLKNICLENINTLYKTFTNITY